MTFRQKGNLTPRQKANRCLAMLLPLAAISFGGELRRGAATESLIFGAVLWGILFVGGYFIGPRIAAAFQDARARKAAAAQPAPPAWPLVHH